MAQQWATGKREDMACSWSEEGGPGPLRRTFLFRNAAHVPWRVGAHRFYCVTSHKIWPRVRGVLRLGFDLSTSVQVSETRDIRGVCSDGVSQRTGSRCTELDISGSDLVVAYKVHM
jgi:hypothetical protein